MLERSRAPRFSRVVAELAVLLLLMQLLATPHAADANNLWSSALDYSAGVKRIAIEAANNAIAIAKAAVDEAMKKMADATTRLTQAGSLAAVIGAFIALSTALQKLEAAKAALAAALKALAVLVAAGAAFVVGTYLGEGIDWLISRCLDPPCVMFEDQPGYLPPSTTQLDGLVPVVMGTTGVSMLGTSRAVFDSADVAQPGMGTRSWFFLRNSIRTFNLAGQAAGAYSAHLCNDVSAAANALQSQLGGYIALTESVATYVENATVYSGNPRPELQAAAIQCDSLVQYVDLHPGEFTDPVEVRAAAVQSRDAALGAIAALDAQSLPDGSPKPLQGPGGFYSSLTLSDFQTFLSNCATQGPAALPPGEAATVDTLMARFGLRYNGVAGAGWDIADYVGEGDNGDEASLFASGPLRPSDIYRTAITHHWAQIDLSESPAVIGCVTTGAPIEPPASPSLVVRVSPSPSDGLPVCEIALSHGGTVSIRVFSVSGGLASTVYSGYLPAGLRRFDLGTGGHGTKRLASGVYYVRVEAGALQETRRFTILR